MSVSLAAKTRRWIGSAAVLVGEPAWVLFSFFSVATVVFMVLAKFPEFEPVAESTLGQLGIGAVVYVLVLSLAVLPLIVWSKKADVRKTLGINRKPTKAIFWLPLVAWAAYMLSTIIVGVLATYIPWIDSDQAQNVGFDNLSQPYEYVLAFVALVVLPPVAEELLFRGYLFGRLRRKFGFVVTTFVVSIVFGLVHLQWNVGIDVAVLSIYLCLLREYTGSVWAGIVLHALKNGLAYAALFIYPMLRG